MVRQTQEPASGASTTFHNFQQEGELVVAIIRVAIIVLAVLAPSLAGTPQVPRRAMTLCVTGAFAYNLVIFLFFWLRVRLRGQRLVMLAIDILLATAWIYLTWQTGPSGTGSPLFPLYYVVVIFGALWYGVPGALGSAGAIAVLYLSVLYPLSGHDPFALIDALFREMIYVFLVAIVTGYLVDAHKREREQWTRSQVLLAQYQERFRAAQEVYELLIPSHAPQVPGLDLAARWRPALQEGGGDFYDAIPLDDGRVVIAIADVSGKHSRGALKLPLFKSAFVAAAQVWTDPGEILSRVNRIVYPLLQPEMFITAAVLIVDPAQHKLHFASAGQDPPVFVRERTRETVPLQAGGLILGIDPNATYSSETHTLEPGDTLCLFTDGVTEARNTEGVEFGYATLEARVQAAVAIGMPADGIAENIFEAVNQYARHDARRDDTTLVVARYRPEALHTRG